MTLYREWIHEKMVDNFRAVDHTPYFRRCGVLGRYTETSPLVVFTLIIGFGLIAGAIMRLRKVRRFLGH